MRGSRRAAKQGEKEGIVMGSTSIAMRIAVSCLSLFALWFSGCTLSTGTDQAVVDELYLHVRASWSPDGRTIAFTSAIQGAMGIYLIDTSGTNTRRLLEGEGVGIAWSPDSRWLCFSRVSSLYRIKGDGDSLIRLNTYVGSIRPSWSPDGKRIAFVQTDPMDIRGIWLYDLHAETASQFITYGNYPSWHPSGDEIVIVDAQVNPSGSGLIYRFLGVDVANLSTRTFSAFSSSADCGFASISPLGNAIVYGLKPADNLAQVWKFDVATNRHVQLTDDGGDYPAWGPGGAKIVYTRTAARDGGLWIMNSDGSGKRRLTKP
ncbi:MAG: hypothetical protein FJ217_16350 [Ignavibacteria bacterium]|nr:hypothetical protein [Ignavibacteria bacterium]